MTPPPTKLRYGEAASQYLLFHAARAPPPHALAIFLHGGFWKSAYAIRPPTCAAETLAPDLLARGFAVAEVEYRRSADAEWGFPHTNADVSRAVALARAQPAVDPHRVFLIGHSAGGTLALWQAAQEAAQKACANSPPPLRTYALAPVADLRKAVRMRLSDEGDAVQRYMHGTPEEVPDAYCQACPMHLVGPLSQVGITVVVGSEDADVPEELVRGFCEKLADAAKARKAHADLLEYKVMEHANHYHVVSATERPWKWIVADMERRAAKSP